LVEQNVAGIGDFFKRVSLGRKCTTIGVNFNLKGTIQPIIK
jgi:hypothetical protein